MVLKINHGGGRATPNRCLELFHRQIPPSSAPPACESGCLARRKNRLAGERWWREPIRAQGFPPRHPPLPSLTPRERGGVLLSLWRYTPPFVNVPRSTGRPGPLFRLYLSAAAEADFANRPQTPTRPCSSPPSGRRAVCSGGSRCLKRKANWRLHPLTPSRSVTSSGSDGILI